MSRSDVPRGLVTVGLVTCNNEGDLINCVQGLQSQDDVPLQLVVVDNASIDRSLEIVRRHLPQAKILENTINEGYCRAHNRAIRESRGEYYLPLNPDVRLLPGFIRRLTQVLESHPNCGTAVGKSWRSFESGPKIIDAAGLFIDRRQHQYLRGHGQVDEAQFDQAQEVFGADGAAPLHRRAMLEDARVAGEVYDESFFLYMEDVDLTWRSRLLGWKCWYEPRAVAVHTRAFRPGRRSPVPSWLRRIAVKNRYLTIIKNESRECWLRDWWRILTYDAGILLYLLALERSSLGAYPALLKQWRQAGARRAELWSRVRTSPQERLDWFA